MADLIVCEVADAFLEALYASDADSAADMDVLLQELWDDQDFLATLHEDTPKFIYQFKNTCEFKRFEEAWARRRRIYILKPYDSDGHPHKYRMMVAHDIRHDYFYVLQVAHRNVSYDPTTQDFATFIAAYDALGLPHI